MNWTLSVIIICVILALLFTWQEFARTDKRRLALRLLAVWLSAAALACLALPITYNGTTIVADGSDAILLTEGFSKDSIPAGTRVFTADRTIKKAYSKATLISHPQQLASQKPAVKQVKILGYGLTTDELQELGTLPVSFNSPSIPEGIQAISWPAKFKTGEPLSIQGQYHNTQTKSVKLILKGLNTGLDSVEVPVGKTSSFALTTLPKPTGRVVYQLLALAGSDTLSADNLPVEIEPTKPVKVLMISTAPNFETKFLKNWLGQNGYAVAARAVISQNKISEEYVNLDKMNLQRLTAGALDKFDVIIGDLSAFKSLSPAEGSALRQLVTQKGLGVIVRADSSDKAASWLQRDFPVNTIAVKDQLSVPLSLQDQKSKTAKLNIDPSFISYRNNTQTLVTDAQNRSLAGVALAGAGKVVFTTLNHTNTWLLAGNQANYASLWSLLINKSARKLPPVQSWKVVSPLPGINSPAMLALQSAVAPANVRVHGQLTAPFQDAAIPYQWYFTYWPQKAGWQTVNGGNSALAWWYTPEKHGWKSLKLLQNSNNTRNYISNRTQKLSVTKQIQQSVKIEVPKLCFYLILLATCTFLWVERKFTA
jgi:hypothetical protein